MISFGTDGWRAVIGEEYTFANVARFGRGLAALLGGRGQSGDGVAVGYDRRFMSDEYARCLAATLAQAGVSVNLATGPSPTPAISLAARHLGTAMAAIITASHNSYQYNGIKLRGADGAPIDLATEAELESILSDQASSPARSPERGRPAFGQVRPYDPWPVYSSHVAGRVDLALIAASQAGVAHDAMHGSAAGWLGRFLPRVRALRCRSDPTFGGGAPEPIDGNLCALRSLVQSSPRPMTGWATDGDGDRLGAVAEDGRYVSPHHLLALVYGHLVEGRRMSGTVVRTVTTSTMVDRLAAAYGWQAEVTPVGFRNVADRLRRPGEPPVLAGGEESGGIGIGMHLPERDAVFAALVLLEGLAAGRRSLQSAVEELEAKVGRACLGRQDIRVPVPGQPEDHWEVPAQLLGEPVAAWRRIDGLNLRLADGAWLHLRASRTEPVVRVYAEAGTPARVQALLRAGRAWVTGTGANPSAADTR